MGKFHISAHILRRNFIVFWKKNYTAGHIYTTAGRDGRDKFQVNFPVSISRPSDSNWSILHETIDSLKHKQVYRWDEIAINTKLLSNCSDCSSDSPETCNKVHLLNFEWSLLNLKRNLKKVFLWQFTAKKMSKYKRSNSTYFQWKNSHGKENILIKTSL